MTRSLIFLAPLAFLVGACSSPQTSQNAQPVPAHPAGTAVTQWGSLPIYTADEGNPLVFSAPLSTPTADYYRGEFDLLVERDGTVSDVFIREASDLPEADQAIAAQFQAARSRLVLAPSDPAPYVIRYTILRNKELARYRVDKDRGDNQYASYNDPYHADNSRPMGTGAPYPFALKPER